ncbi:MAG: hypothetical protein M3Y91_02885 [Actinomycetota bacterium]|nr:hypothetical protein [Actinomycetota bacterium]
MTGRWLRGGSSESLVVGFESGVDVDAGGVEAASGCTPLVGQGPGGASGGGGFEGGGGEGLVGGVG